MSDDATDSEIEKDSLSARLRLEELLSEISVSAIKVEDVPSFIDGALMEIGETIGVSRVEITELNQGTQTGTMRYQWTAEGVSSSIGQWKDIPILAAPTGRAALLEDKPFMFEDAETHPFPQIRDLLRSTGTTSILGVPILLSDQPYGILAFESVGRRRKWPENEVRQLAAVARIIGQVIEHRRMEERLRMERDRAENYLNTVRAIVVLLDKDGRVALINKKGCEVLHAEENEIVGKDWFGTFVPEKNRSEVRRVFDQILSGTKEFVEDYENPVVAKNGEIRTIAWHNALLRDESGNIVHTLSTGEDITDHLRTEADLKAAVNRLARVNADLEEERSRSRIYFDFLAHDTANIISPIMAYAELISSEKMQLADMRKMAAKIMNQTERVSSLVHNLRKLDMLKRLQPMEMPVVDIRRIIARVERSIRRRYPKRELTISNELPQGVAIRARGEESIDFTLHHILDNAVKYAGKDRVTINVRAANEAADDGKRYWRIEVEDDGPGISDESKKEIVAPLDPSKRYSRGVASSLAFCSSVIMDIGGYLQIDDRVPGKSSKGAKIIMRVLSAD